MHDETQYRRKVQQDFIETMNKLVGIPCVGFNINESSNKNNGYTALYFGNSHATENERPDYILLMACLWRIETRDHVLGTFTGSKRGITNSRELGALLELIKGSKAETLEIIQPSFDLKIAFSEGYAIQIMVGGADSYQNYRLFDLFPSLNENPHYGYDVEENGRVDYMPIIPPE